VSTTKAVRSRGRPRRFDPEAAVATGKRLFHRQGFDAVGIATVTEALGINPPSFYAAFGSKAAFFAQVLARYAREDGVPLDQLLREDRPVAESLGAVLLDAAQRYSADPHASGCMVLEGLGADDADARRAAMTCQAAAEESVRRFVQQRHPGQAECVTDLVSTTMAGMSARARQGLGVERLTAVATLAAEAIARALDTPATPARAGKAAPRTTRSAGGAPARR
jgi:TetR/AcrR family transcriptional repressor for divergent bdcA